jgi:hypothetical protein
MNSVASASDGYGCALVRRTRPKLRAPRKVGRRTSVTALVAAALASGVEVSSPAQEVEGTGDEDPEHSRGWL